MEREIDQVNGAPKPNALNSAERPQPRRLSAFLMVTILLILVLAAFFFRSFVPDYTLFSNDGPLGRLMADYQKMPQKFSGTWQDLNSIGCSLGAAWPNITSGLLWLLGPIGFSKFYAPLGLLILGMGAWCFFRQVGLGPAACVLGALAGTLNSSFFSAACWGIAAHPLTIGMSFFALAALIAPRARRQWVKASVAGLAVGIGVAEGADLGALFSVYVAGFAMYRAFMAEGTVIRRLTQGIGQVVIMAAVASLVAAEGIHVLSATQLHGVPGTQVGTLSPQQARWDWATQWSLPKREALNLIAPGLFGYRMDSPHGGNYWGAVGRDAAWDRYFANGRQGEKPTGYLRFAGGGVYAGILVVVVAMWAAFQALQRKDSVFLPAKKRLLWFWLVVMVGSLLLALGRYAPFYWVFYRLPYSSGFRNPAKFLHVVNWALVVLFAYGIHGLSSLYLSRTAVGLAPFRRLGEWWRKASAFERRWCLSCGGVIAVSLLAALVYISSGAALTTYLQGVGFNETFANEIARFSFREVGWYLLFLTLSVGLVVIILTGRFAGRRSKSGTILLGLLLLLDLGRANQPWLVYWNYPQKYASNPIVDLLREKPYEHRVASLPPWLTHQFELPQNLVTMEGHWDDSYQSEWLQQLFPYYDVQSLDLVQMRTVPQDLATFENVLQFQGTQGSLRLIPRRWELTNTRYLLGCAGLLPVLNQSLDPQQQRFRIISRFDFFPKPGIVHPTRLEEITSVPSMNGPFALFDFAGALPRASLYSNWQVITNDEAALNLLTNVTFDPAHTVVVSQPLPISSVPAPSAGSVTFTSYAPKEILLEAVAPVPSVLLLNDHFAPDWKVYVDGEQTTLLRCNFIMRGVVVPAGNHQIQFRFSPRLAPLYLSLSAIVTGLFLTGLLLLDSSRRAVESARR